MATFAERLDELRRKRGLSKKDLASKMGISPSTLSGYLSGKNTPNLVDFCGYVHKIDVRMEWLAGEETENTQARKFLVCYDDSGNVSMVAKIINEINDVYVVEQYGALDMSVELMLGGGEPDDRVGEICDVYEISKDELKNPKLFYSWLGVKGEIARDFARRQNAV